MELELIPNKGRYVPFRSMIFQMELVHSVPAKIGTRSIVPERPFHSSASLSLGHTQGDECTL